MVLRVAKGIAKSRVLEVGYDVAVSMRGFTYAQYKEMEAAAMRLSSQTVPDSIAMARDAYDDDEMPPEVEDATRAQFHAHLLSIVLMRFGESWRGLEDEETGEPLPMNATSIAAVLEQFPGVSLSLAQQILTPYQQIASEGKGSAPLPDTDTPVD